jgi:uncharacterized surface protein with fasciclin (FAS1) repeats
MRACYDKQSTFSLAMAKIAGKPIQMSPMWRRSQSPDVYQSNGIIHVVNTVLLPN